MGATCTLCQHASKYNPIVDKDLLKSTNNSIKIQNPPPNLYLNAIGIVSINNSKATIIKPGSIESRSSNFSESDYIQYMNLQKVLLFKNVLGIKCFNFNELTYEGELDENDKRDGKGMLKWPNGTAYLGQWMNNKATGKGILSFSSEHYEGMFLDNCFEGEGIYIDNKGTRYEGIWMANFLDGLGSETYTEGHRFEGTYRFGKKNGKGSIYFSDGSYFNGEFREDEIDGYGVYIWPKIQRSIYRGIWKNNKMNGLGQMIWFDSGKMYYGNYVNNKKNGLGIFFWGLNKKWAGYWKDGLRDGPGILIFSDNTQERGIWDKGEKIDISDQNKDQIYKEIEEFYQKTLSEFNSFEK